MPNFTKLVLLLISFFYSHTLFAQSENYQRVKVWTNDRGLLKLSSLGIETDHGSHKKGIWFISDYSDSELEKIKAAGFRTEVVIENVSDYYKNQTFSKLISPISPAAVNCQAGFPVYQQPVNFSLGSYAGYFTYQEMLDNLDSMASKYPSIITIKQAIPGGTTHENRPIYFVKISDNAAIDEPEPEVMYSAVHHAREPGGMSQLIYYMWYLLENYGSDQQIDAILNNTELFFVPCLNPDGYIYNEVNEPAGGGLWRKNRRDNLDGSFGVDLNRNYGYFWGFDDNGSSPITNSATYRGDTPFSEPETQLMRDFSNSRSFLLALNYHTFGNLLIYPWGYDYSIYTPDSALLSNYGELLTTYNGYAYGTADQTVGYIVNGSSDDWMYGEQTTKPKILAMTPECGDASMGFWPPAGEIIPLCESTMFQNITTALLAGKYADINEVSPYYISAGGGYIKFNVKQLGLDTTATYTISLTPITSNIFQTGNPVQISNLSLLQEVTDSISFGLNTPMTNGELIQFVLSIDNGSYSLTDTITKIFGPETVVFASDGSSTAGFNAGQWGISTTLFYSPTSSITDSPSGNYGSNETKSIRTSANVDLSNAVSASLSFYARWEIETNYDYVVVQVSDNNGATWNSLCGNYTVPGGGFQLFNEPIYEGFQFNWVKEEMSLDDYLGQNIQIRFRLVSDNFSEFDGFYFDDLVITKILPGTNSIEEFSTTPHQISVNPNPASQYTYVTTDQLTSPDILYVYNSIGQLVYKYRLPVGSTSYKLDTDSFEKGVYYIKVAGETRISSTVKLVVR